MSDGLTKENAAVTDINLRDRFYSPADFTARCSCGCGSPIEGADETIEWNDGEALVNCLRLNDIVCQRCLRRAESDGLCAECGDVATDDEVRVEAAVETPAPVVPAILTPDECALLRQIASGEPHHALGAFVAYGSGIGRARQLIRAGLVVETHRWNGRRASRYYRTTAFGRRMLGTAVSS